VTAAEAVAVAVASNGAGTTAVGVPTPGSAGAVAVSVPLGGNAPVPNGGSASGQVAPGQTAAGTAGSGSWGRAVLGTLNVFPFIGVTRAAVRSLADGVLANAPADPADDLAPGRADLLTDFAPFDRSSLEYAIDRLLDKFEGAGRGLSSPEGVSDLMTGVMAVAVALTASKVVFRGAGGPRDEEATPDDAYPGAGPDGLPGFPDPWGLGQL
jgi:hypothetical protein